MATETLVGSLQLDIGQFTAQLNAATQQFASFAQGVQSQIQQATQSFGSLTQASRDINQQLTTETRRARNEQLQVERDAQRAINQAFRQERQQMLETERDIQRAINQAARTEQQTRIQQERDAQRALNQAARVEHQQQLEAEQSAQRAINQVYRQERQYILDIERDIQRAVTQAARAEHQSRLQEERDIQRAINQAVRTESQQRVQAERETQQAVNQAFRAQQQERKALLESVNYQARQLQQQAIIDERASLEQRKALYESVNYQITQLERNAANQQRAIRRELQTEQRIGAIGTPSISPALQPTLGLLQGYQNLLGPLAEQQERFNARLAAMGQILGAAGIATGIFAIVAALKEFTVSAVQNATTVQSLRAAFTAITGSAEGANRELKFLRETSQRVGVDFLETANAFKGLEAASRGTKLEGEETRKIFVAMVEASRVLGLRSDQTRLALLALEQMISKGKVSSEELRRQLGEHLPGAMQLAARAMGVTTEQLSDMLKRGEVLTEDFLPKFRREIERAFGPGLVEATKTGAATFAKFANNMRDISIDAGNSIIKVVQPVLEFLNKILEHSRRIKAEAASAQEDTLRTAVEGRLQGTSVKLSDLTPDEVATIGGLLTGQTPVNIIDRFQKGNAKTQADAIIAAAGQRAQQRILEQRYLEEDALIGAGSTDQPFAKQVTETKELTTKLKDDLNAIDNFYKRQPSLIGAAAEKLRVVEKAQRDIAELQAQTPGLQQHLIPQLAREADALQSRATQLQKQVDLEDAAEKARKKAEQEAKQLDTERKRTTEQLTDQIIELTQNEFEAKRQLLDRELAHFRKIGVDETTVAAYEAAARNKIAEEEATARLEELRKSNQAYAASLETKVKVAQDIEQEITRLEAKETKSRQDDFLAAQAKKREAFIQQGALNDDIARFDEATHRESLKIQTDETQKELQKQQRAYEQFAKGIENTLSNVFVHILDGSRSIFDSIKQLFFKLLADLAAAALTRAVIIPIITHVVGGGSAAFGANGFSLSSIFGGGDTGTGGSTGSGVDALGTAIGGLQQGASLYSSLTGNNLSVGGLVGKIPFVQNLLNTGVFTFGGSSGAALVGTSGSLVGGSFAGSAIGGATLSSGATLPAAIGGTAGDFAALGGSTGGLLSSGGASAGAASATTITAGTLLGAAGAGIGAGLFLSQLNDILGIKDAIGSAGSGALAGAGGGALAGTIILPGIGTAIGAIAGALLGGLAGGLLGKKQRTPKIDITDVIGGQVGFNQLTEQLDITQPFNIQQASFLEVGKYPALQQTLKGFDDAVNGLVDQLVGAFRGLSPKVQEALVAPVNALLDEVRASLEVSKFEGKGEELTKQIDLYFNKGLPKLFQDLFDKVKAGVQKLDPVVRAFTDTIDSASEILQSLNQQQAQLQLSLEGQIHSLQEGLFSPAQLFLRRQDELESVRQIIQTGTPQQKLAAIPIAQNLVNELFNLGKSEEVLGQDPALVRKLQSDLVEVLKGLQLTTDDVFGGFKSEVQTQIDLAQQQVDILISSLGSLDSIDTIISDSLPVLNDIRAALAPFSNQDAVNTQVNQLLAATSVQSLQSIDVTAQAQLQQLQSINAAVGGLNINAGGFAPQGSGGDSFQLGTGYVPRNMWAYLHAGERVIPMYQNHGEPGGDITININGSSGDPNYLANQIIEQIERRGGRLGNSRIMIAKR